ncbi:MAG: hypothetical protein AAFP97_13505, partial [Pseudomonadota bacterium]
GGSVSAQIEDAAPDELATPSFLTTQSTDDPAPADALVEWERRQNAEERLTPLGIDLMGDQIDPHTGSISFTHTDISLPGNFDIPVSLTRKLSQGFLYADSVDAEFGDWSYDVPRIIVTSAEQKPFDGNRCSESFGAQFNLFNDNTRFWAGDQYTNGVKLHVPGSGSQEILEKSANDPMWPTGATHVTTKNWYFTCGTASDGGEGFIGYSPNGDIYNFDRVITMDKNGLGDGANVLPRKTYILAATLITDVNGNTVSYQYDTLDRLQSISASDGRLIDLAYAGNSSLVSTVSANGRTWAYQYRDTEYELPEWRPSGYSPAPGPGLSHKILDKVTLPDGRTWEFDLDNMLAEPGPARACGLSVTPLEIKHPSGALGIFALQDTRHRSFTQPLAGAATECPLAEPTPGGGFGTVWQQYNTTNVISVTRKEIRSPLAPIAVWDYTYESDESSAVPAAEDRVNWTKVSGPDEHRTYYHYWNSEPNGGRLKREEIRETENGSILRAINYSYLIEESVGESYFGTASNPGDVKNPVRTVFVEIEQDGDTYSTTTAFETNQNIASYSYGFPTTVTEASSTLTRQRVRTSTYEHNKTAWIIGLLKSVTRNGKRFDDFDYDALGRLTEHRRFGETAAFGTYTYNPDGTIETWNNALGETVTLSNYNSGLAQTILRPDGETMSRVVDNNGWITSQTNARNFTTGFEYNRAGWLTKIIPPKNDGAAADTVISYQYLPSIQNPSQTVQT